MRRCLLALLMAATYGALAMPVLDLASAAELARAGACVAVAAEPGARMLYQASAGAAGLDGELAGYPLLHDAAGRPAIAARPVWNAGSLLEVRDPASRRLYTGQRDGSRLRTIALEWQALDPAQRLLLSNECRGAPGQQCLAYLRGERALEAGRPGGVLRPRRGLLGATVIGAPLYVAPPVAANDDMRRAAFIAAAGSRPATVYLQANDGMLHAFDAASGTELFAYLPQALQPYWPRLFTSVHAASPYADGALAAGDALVGGAWKTVLVGALGSAAQGLFALDISNPARFGQDGSVLFEFTDQDDPDIGNIFNAPSVARFRTGVANHGDFVVVASGYNNNRLDGEGRSNPAGPGVLFLLSLDKEASGAWQLNRNYFKLALPAASAAQANGLAQPALVPDADGSVRSAFAGDLQGQIWRLDFSSAPPWNRQVAAPLFAATDAGGKRQPVTAPMRAVHAEQGLLLLFGTGRLLEAADADNKSPQSFYAVSDQMASAPPASRGMLARRQPVGDGAGGYRLEGGPLSPNGWLLDFPVAGERLIGSPLARDGNLYFATMVPGASACAPVGGLYLLDALKGQSPAFAITPWVGLAVQPGRTLAVAPGRGPAPGGGTAGPGTPAGNAVLGAGAGKPVPYVVKKIRAGRLGWREVGDWEAIRNATPQK